MKRWWTWVGLGILAVALLAVVSCGGDQAAGDPEAVELRSYSVPEGFSRQEWRDMLSATLQTGETRIGTVAKGPANTLVVTAPRSVHEGVERLLDELISHGPRKRPALRSVSVDYWIILGKPLGAGGAGSHISAGRLDQVKSLDPVLGQIASAHGPMEYHLLEQLQLTSIDNKRSQVRGRHFTVHQNFMDDGSGGQLADISIGMKATLNVFHSLESRIKLEPGRFIVLGQTAYDGRKGFLPTGIDPADDLMLYYVIAAQSD